jgi:hypothetical protein
MKAVLIYVNTSKDVGDVDHLEVFANEDAAEKWSAENDPEGVSPSNMKSSKMTKKLQHMTVD